MYQVFLGELPLPIAPSKITTKVGNRSQTIELINGDEVNIVKGAALQEITFDMLIPAQDYPFMTMVGSVVGDLLGGLTGAVSTTAVTMYLEKLKNDKEPFVFVCVRLGEGLSVTGVYNTTIKVTLEDYTVLEDANYGRDYMVNVRLKEWKDYSTSTIDKNGNVTKVRPK